jgi:hypothetical protein
VALDKAPFRPLVNSSKPLPGTIIRFMEDVLTDAQLGSCYITSIARTPREQATAMFDNCRRTGVGEQYRTYLDAGDAVIDVFAAADPASLDTAEGRMAVIRDMTAKIIEVGPDKVSHHCLPPDSPLDVFDIRQNSILSEVRFTAALKKHPRFSKLLIENNVYHVEAFKEAPQKGTPS